MITLGSALMKATGSRGKERNVWTVLWGCLGGLARVLGSCPIQRANPEFARAVTRLETRQICRPRNVDVFRYRDINMQVQHRYVSHTLLPGQELRNFRVWEKGHGVLGARKIEAGCVGDQRGRTEVSQSTRHRQILRPRSTPNTHFVQQRLDIP